jgi:hypothetical protein
MYFVNCEGKNHPSRERTALPNELTEQSGKTTLRLFQGDFSVMAEGEKYHRLSAQVWDQVLPKIKALAENENE